MLGVCFRRETRAHWQDQWSFVFSNFGVTEIWERGGDNNKDADIYQPTVPIDSCAELPSYPLVLLAPIDGRYLRGDESLVAFEHPSDAIYVFGGSHDVLTEDEMGGRAPEHCVYIPTLKYEMYAFSAAYVTLYDRFVKRGDFG